VLAVNHGADAIVVSNHGGGSLMRRVLLLKLYLIFMLLWPLNLRSLGEGTRFQLFFDGGVRTGADVFKALARGADFVLVGRPVLWGLGYKGSRVWRL